MNLLHSLPGTEAHLALEALAYFVGGRVYWVAARDLPRPADWIDRMALFAGAVLGAALGSKVLHILEHLPFLMQYGTPALWLGGKSILGGFIGGTLGVELAKHRVGWVLSTGDAWVPALAVGLVIGRMGCQLSGLWDQTYGNQTSLPWGWDYGDGMFRHPTALYEILLIALLYFGTRKRWGNCAGARFAAFLAGYCVIRFALEFLKPPFGPPAAGTLPTALMFGLSAIQWTALAGLAGYAWLFTLRTRNLNALSTLQPSDTA